MTRVLELWSVAVLGAATALAGAWWFSAPQEPVAEIAELAEVDEAQARLEASSEELRDALEREATQREMLAAEVELMRSVLEQLAAAQVSGSMTPGAADLGGAASPQKGRVAPIFGGMQFEEDRLASLGMIEGEIAELRRRWDSAQLAKLELSDRAARTGTLMRPSHRRGTNQIEVALRRDLGDEAYDKLLYATNQLNRILVKQVIGGSAAAYAGLRAGDELLSYAGGRIFKPAGLRFRTVMGKRGEQVRLELERDGERISVFVPRGPLGVLMSAASRPPR